MLWNTKILAAVCGSALAVSSLYSTAPATGSTAAGNSALHQAAARVNPIATDDFTSLRAWGVYHGNGALGIQGARLSQNVELRRGPRRSFARVHVRPVTERTVVGGTVLHPGDYAAGGMSHRLAHQSYGRWVMDLRMRDTQRGVRAVALTWPEGPWPRAGEIDFVENGADLPPSSGHTAIANHYAKSDGSNAQEVRHVAGDFTKWVRVEVVWRVDRLVISFDGLEVFRTTQHVPTGPMFLCVQTAVAGGGQKSQFEGRQRSPGYIDIANLAVYN